jgi:hypothetical protein
MRYWQHRHPVNRHTLRSGCVAAPHPHRPPSGLLPATAAPLAAYINPESPWHSRKTEPNLICTTIYHGRMWWVFVNTASVRVFTDTNRSAKPILLHTQQGSCYCILCSLWYLCGGSLVPVLVCPRLLMPCAKPTMIRKSHHYSTGGIRPNIRFLWGSVLPLRLVGSSTSHPLL